MEDVADSNFMFLHMFVQHFPSIICSNLSSSHPCLTLDSAVYNHYSLSHTYFDLSFLKEKKLSLSHLSSLD